MAFNPSDPFFETTVTNLIDQRISQSQLSSLVRQLQGGGAWTVPALSNSWVAYSATRPVPRYTVNGGFVYCEGAVKNGTAATATVFTFPTGLRPAYVRDFVGVNDSNALVVGTVTTAGVLSFVAGGSTVFTSFQVMFRAEG